MSYELVQVKLNLAMHCINEGFHKFTRRRLPTK